MPNTTPLTNKYQIRLIAIAVAVLTVCVAAFAASAQATPYEVIGTGGTLKVRTEPNLSAQVVAELRDSTGIDIVCQTRGEQVVGSTMWDKIDQPAVGYVADWYTTTPVVNDPSPGLASCSPPSAPATQTTPSTPSTAKSTTPQPGSRTDKICNIKTTAVLGWKVYEVCLSGGSSYNNSSVTANVSGVYCNIFAPTGSLEGYACSRKARSWGTYWNTRLGARETWFNQRIDDLQPDREADFLDHSVCVYLRIDTKPNGYTTYQNFSTVVSFAAKC